MDSAIFDVKGRTADGAESEDVRDELDRRSADRDRRRRLAMSEAGRGLKSVYALMAVLLIGYAVLVIVRRDVDSWPAVDDWGVSTFEIIGSALCILRGFVGRHRSWNARLVPILLGLGFMSWSLGDLVLAIHGEGGAVTPLLTNVFYLCFYPLAYVGVMLLVQVNARRLTAESWLDGIIAGLGAASCSTACCIPTAATPRPSPPTSRCRSVTCCCWRW
jgi:hypothetical protein